MATQKPSKPDVILPNNFGGTKTPYTDSQISNGYQEAVPQVVDGGNINYEKDAVFKYLKYLKTTIDALVDMPIGKSLIIDSNNRFDYISPENVSNKTNKINEQSTENQYPNAKAVYEAINATDVNADIKSFINTVYPVGSLYFSTATTCPLQSFGIGTWQNVGTSLTLSVNTSVPVKGDGKSIGFKGPVNTSKNPSGTYGLIQGIGDALYSEKTAYGANAGSVLSTSAGTGVNRGVYGITTDSTKSGIVGTVTRTQITVNVFQRIS